MIVLFTSNTSGGIIQFISQVFNELVDMGYETKVFLPDDAQVHIENRYLKYIVRYNKIKTINVYSKRIGEIANCIEKDKPEYVWFFDNAILSSEIGLRLSKKVKKILTMHDAGGVHPSNDESIKVKMHRIFENKLSCIFESKVDNVLVLSNESRKKYEKLNPEMKNKIVKINLGAHVPDVNTERVREVSFQEYILFFGRIDKYKGLENLFRAFSAYSGKYSLVVAGKGEFTNSEKDLIKSNHRIVIVNRYLDDGEMIWLFKNARALVLPYIEATQSGIIPIAYKYAKPVIVSNVPGLTQFVSEGETGYISRNIEELTNAFIAIENEDMYLKMKKKCLDYYNRELEWKKNLTILLNELKIVK